MSDEYVIGAKITADDSGFQAAIGRMNTGLNEWGVNLGAMYNKGAQFLQGFGIDVDKFAAKLGTSGPVVAGFVGVGIAAVKVYGEIDKLVQEFEKFDTKMSEVFTLLPDLSEKAKTQITQDVKDFSREFGTLPNEVIPALYQAISAGVPQDNVFSFLEAAQKAAVGGVSTLQTSVDGLSSVVNAYGADVLSVEKASDIMFTTVKDGKTDFNQLSASLYNVVPTAAAAGVAFSDIGAALAAITAQGTPTTVATTQLRQLFVELSKEGTKVSDKFNELAGVSFKEFVAKGNNVQDALSLMEQYAKKTGIGLNDMFSSVEAGSAALQLTGNGAQKFKQYLDDMTNSAGATDKAFKTMDETLGMLRKKTEAAKEVLIVTTGEMFAPLVAGVLKSTTEIFNAFTEIVTAISPIVSPIVGIIGDVLSEVSDIVEDFVDFFTTTIVNTPAYEALVNMLEQTRVALKGIMDNIGELVKTTFAFVLALVNGDFNKAWLLAEKIILIMVKNATDSLSGFLNIFIGFTNGLISTANKLLDKVGMHINEISEVSLASTFGITKAMDSVDAKLKAIGVTTDTNKAKTKEASESDIKALNEQKAASEKLAAYLESWNKTYTTDKLASIELERQSELKKANEVKASATTIDQINEFYDKKRIDYIDEVAKKENDARKKKEEQEKATAEKIAAYELDWTTKSTEYTKKLYETKSLFSDENLQKVLDTIEKEEQAEIKKATSLNASEKTLADIHSVYEMKKVLASKESSEKIQDNWKKLFSNMQDITSTFTSYFNKIVNAWSGYMKAYYDKLEESINNELSLSLSSIDIETQAKLAAAGLSVQTELERLQAEYDAAVAEGDLETANQLAQEIARTKIIEEGEQKKKEATEKAEKEKAQIKYKADMAAWNAQLLSAIAGAAAAIVQGFAQLGPIGGAIAAVTTGIVTGLQIAAINDAKPQPPAFAIGTSYFKGGMALVGEQGPELVNLPQGSKVNTANETQNMLGSKGGLSVTINSPKAVNPSEAAAIFRRTAREMAFVGAL